MPELSRAQLAVYAALAIVILMLGARWIRADDSTSYGAEPAAAGAPGPSAPAGDGDGEQAFAATDEDLVVHVAGEVKDPGVYRMPAGSRVTDAIERAGGTTGAAAADAINLAAPLADGQQVSIPAGSRAPAGDVSSASADDPASGPISLGAATAEQLDTIEGIGPVTAAAILEFRDERGGVASIDELDEISGIGPATMEALRARLQP